jgi:hypothetical protein
LFERLKQGIGAYSKGEIRYGKFLCEMVIFSQTTVNRKGMGANIRAYGGRILLNFQSCGI